MSMVAEKCNSEILMAISNSGPVDLNDGINTKGGGSGLRIKRETITHRTSAEDQTLIVDLHNTLRRGEGASNMIFMVR